MAHQSYSDATQKKQEFEVQAPDGRVFKGLYCDPKLDRETLPAGWNAYDIRHDDDGTGVFCTLEHDYVRVNNAGTFFLEGEIPELREAKSSVNFKIEPEEWLMAHGVDPDDPDPELLESIEPCPEARNDDWEYNFIS